VEARRITWYFNDRLGRWQWTSAVIARTTVNRHAGRLADLTHIARSEPLADLIMDIGSSTLYGIPLRQTGN
jgi:hypothetical protein